MLVYNLGERGYMVSVGSACDNGNFEDSHVLTSVNYPKDYINGNIRITFNENNTVDAKFYRLEFKNSIFGNERINYVYCKANINGEKRILKSIGFKEKPKPLNDTFNISVYIDNKNNYLVNIYDLI